MEPVLVAYELRRRGVARPHAVAAAYVRLKRFTRRVDGPVEASLAFLARALRTTVRGIRRLFDVMRYMGWVRVDAEGSFSLKQPKRFTMVDALSHRAISRVRSRVNPRAFSSPQTIGTKGSCHTLTTSTLSSEKRVTGNVVVRSSSQSVLSVVARARPDPATEAGEVEAVVTRWAKKAGKTAPEIRRDMLWLRRHDEGRVRSCLQSVELKLARGKRVDDPLRLFWALVHGGGRGEEGADANRAEFLRLLAREAQDNVDPVSNSCGRSRPGLLERLAARVLEPTLSHGRSESEPAPTRPASPQRHSAGSSRPVAEQVPAASTSSPRISTFDFAAWERRHAVELREEAFTLARRQHETAMLRHAEDELRAHLAGRPLPSPPAPPEILCVSVAGLTDAADGP